MTKKKIIYLVTQSEWGGAQEYVYNLAINLDKNEFEVLVLAGEGDDSLFKTLAKHSIPYQKLKYTKRAINPFLDVMALFELINIFKKEKPDVIHLNSSKIGFLGSLASKLIINYKSSIIYTAHGWVFTEPLNPLKKNIYKFIEKTSAPWKDKIITVSEFDRQTALEHKFKSEIITIHNALDSTKLNFLEKDDARSKFESQSFSPRSLVEAGILNSQSLIIGTIANFYPTKGLTYLIDAAKLLIDKNPDLTFVIIGDGREKENLKLRIKNLGLTDKIILTGIIPQAYKYLKAFDLFVLPSVKEGLPYTLLEAMVADIPIVATKVGGIPEIIDNNYLVEAQNSQALADKIEQVLNNPDVKQQHNSPDYNEFLNKIFSLYK